MGSLNLGSLFQNNRSLLEQMPYTIIIARNSKEHEVQRQKKANG